MKRILIYIIVISCFSEVQCIEIDSNRINNRIENFKFVISKDSVFHKYLEVEFGELTEFTIFDTLAYPYLDVFVVHKIFPFSKSSYLYKKNKEFEDIQRVNQLKTRMNLFKQNLKANYEIAFGIYDYQVMCFLVSPINSSKCISGLILFNDDDEIIRYFAEEYTVSD